MNRTKVLCIARVLAAALCCTLSLAPAHAADAPKRSPGPAAAAPQGYKLNINDTIEVSIFDEPDLTANRSIDSSGQIYLPLLTQPVTVAGKTIRDAEVLIQKLYVDGKLLKHPTASIKIVEYAPREVEVTGAVNQPGMLQFPKERTSLDLTEVIARCGDFTDRAKQSAIQILHTNEDGTESSITVNYRDLKKAGRDRVIIYPGDKIWVPEIII